MFYAHIVLAKKGPLARIWLAAHWDKKLTKAHVFETNIEQSVEGIMQPKVKLALRTSGHLLLGVVRIYSRKAKYLLADCNEAFVKIKMAFRPGIVDLPEGHREAAVNAITLPEVFHDFDTALPELNDVDIEAQFSINQSRADEITMREDYGSLSVSIHEDGFGDMGFDAESPDLVRDGMEAHIDENLFAEELGREIDHTKEPVPGTSREMLAGELPEPGLGGEGFGDEFGQPAAGLFEGDIFGEPQLPQPEAEALPKHDDDSDQELDHFDTAGPLPSPMDHSAPPSEVGEEAATAVSPVPPVEGAAATEEARAEVPTDQTTLLKDEEESFALAPVDATQYKGVTKAKRKRKLIVDEIKNISGEEMKSQLANTSDIVTTLDLAPPTKRLMYWKETGGVEKLFALPSRDIPARCLFVHYQRHLISRMLGVEEYPMLGPSDVLGIDQAQEQEVPTRKMRKRKAAAVEAVETQQEVPEPSIHEPEPIREEPDTGISAVSLDMGERAAEETLMPPPATPGYEGLLSDMGPITTNLPTVPMTPSIEHIESIPTLSADQVTSILGAEEGGIADLDYGDLGYPGAPLPEADGRREAREIVSDWTDFEDFPPVSMLDEEQQEDETGEQFEERVLNKRAAQMFVAIKRRMQKKDEITLSEITTNHTRKQAAQKFYSLLVLKKFRALEITQDEPYGDMYISKGPMFDNPQL